MTDENNDTADRIDATNRANQYPDEAPLRSIEAALEGRPLVDVETLQQVDAECGRCVEKNIKRQMAGIEEADERLRHGDRVTIYAVHRDSDDPTTRPHWELTSLSHAEHEHLDFEDVIASGTALVRGEATLHERPDRELFIIDVELQNHSKTTAGPGQSLVAERREQYLEPDDGPGDIPLLDRPAEAPPAEWPESDRRWLEELVDEHGPLSYLTYRAGPPSGRVGGW